MMAHWEKTFFLFFFLLLDTEALPMLKWSGIPVKEGRSSGSPRFIVNKDRQGRNRGGKREKTDNSGAKPHQKGKKKKKKDIQSLKTVL